MYKNRFGIHNYNAIKLNQINDKKTTCHLMEFLVYSRPLGKNQRQQKARQILGNRYNNNNNDDDMEMVIPIVIGALGIVTKGLLQGLEDFEMGG